MDELEIAFDTKEKFEYFIKYLPLEYEGELTKDKTKKYYIIKKQDLVPKKLGTFLLDFLNTDFNIFNSFKTFILEYIFMYLFFKIHNHISVDSIIHDEELNIILSEEEIETNLTKMFELYKNEFIEYQNIYKAIAVRKYRKIYYSCNNKDYETYSNYVRILAPTILDLRINNSTSKFQLLYNYKNIKNSFVSKNFYDILYISLKNLLDISKNIKILRCKHCNRYFIPDTNHNTKYCDFLFDGKRTCKSIESQKTHKENLEEDVLLKVYRKRYKDLASQASHTRPTSKSNQMYEYYKKEGPIMRYKYIKGEITASEFKKWIDSTMIHKKSNEVELK